MCKGQPETSLIEFCTQSSYRKEIVAGICTDRLSMSYLLCVSLILQITKINMHGKSFLHNMSGKITPHIYNIIIYCVVAPGILHKVYCLVAHSNTRVSAAHTYYSRKQLSHLHCSVYTCTLVVFRALRGQSS